MRLLTIVMILLTLSACVASTPPQVETPPGAKVNTVHGIESAKEFSGSVTSWGNVAPSSSTLSIWVQDIRSTNYVLFQVRANLDTYRFALSHEQIISLIDALDNYLMIVRQTSGENTTAIGWLYRANIKMKRLGEETKDDRFIVNIERLASSEPVLSLTFDSWLLSFGGQPSLAERTYKAVVFTSEKSSRLRNVLNEYAGRL